MDWKELLGWGEKELDDLRFVGYSYIKQGKYDVALSFFSALVALDETNPYNLQTIGALYLEKGEHLKALDHLERALQLDSSHAPSLLNRIKALLGLGYKKQALSQAKQLMTNPDTAIASEAEALLLAYS